MLGGGDIAVLCGVALGAGEHGVGYVCDQAGQAAAVAVGIEPGLRAAGRPPLARARPRRLLDHLGLEPILDLGLRVGEAGGAIAALAVLRLALAAHDGTAAFAEASRSSG